MKPTDIKGITKDLYNNIIMRYLCVKVLFLKLFLVIVLLRYDINNDLRLVYVKNKFTKHNPL